MVRIIVFNIINYFVASSSSSPPPPALGMAMWVVGAGKKAGAALGGAVAGAELVLAVGGALLVVVGLALGGGAALLLVVRLALAGAEVVMKEDVCASSTSSPSESSKNYFPTSSAIYVTEY